MITLSTTLDGLLSWQVPPDVHATITYEGPGVIPLRLRLDRCPWGEVGLRFDRPMSAAKVVEVLDDAVDDLRRSARLLLAARVERRQQ